MNVLGRIFLKFRKDEYFLSDVERTYLLYIIKDDTVNKSVNVYFTRIQTLMWFQCPMGEKDLLR